MKKRTVKNFIIFFLAGMILFCGGCATENPNIWEREALALSRIVCSPVNMVGFTYAECEHMGAGSIILFPFIMCLSVPSGAVAMTFDILLGCGEMLTTLQAKSARYPWQSFDRENSQKWQAITLAMLGAASAAASAVEASRSSRSSSYSSSSSSHSYGSSGSKVKPRVRHSSCSGTGQCNICRGRGRVGSDIRCSGCGGSGICRPCRGAGYVN